MRSAERSLQYEHLVADAIDRARAGVSKAMALAAEPIASDAGARTAGMAAPRRRDASGVAA